MAVFAKTDCSAFMLRRSVVFGAIQLVHFHDLSSTSLAVYSIYYSHRNQSKVVIRFDN
jgi:hypothetical protein